MIRLNEALQARSPEIAEVISGEVGMPITWSTMVQAGLPTGNMQSYATLLDGFEFEEKIGNTLVVKEPVGVVGAITPWNYPLHQIVCKLGGALAAGCTFVLKPSEVAPLNVFILAEIVRRDRPAGGCVQPRHRHRRRCRRSDFGSPRHRHGELHRVDPRRKAGRADRRPPPGARPTSARLASPPTSSSTMPTSRPAIPGGSSPATSTPVDVYCAHSHARTEQSLRRGRYSC